MKNLLRFISRGAQALAVLLALACAWGAYAQALPRLGEDGLMPRSDEVRIAVDVARSLYTEPDALDDPLLTEYVGGVFQKLIAAGRSSGAIDPAMKQYPWRLIVGADTTVNAFSVPGGVVGLNLGIVGMTAYPDELASVLGHEISHVTQRHIARMQVQQKQMRPFMIGTMLLGLIAAGKNADMGEAMMVGSQGLMAQNQLIFSRNMEREADRMGFLLMQRAGYNPAGFPSMFEKLQDANRINDDGSYPYLRTHPLTTERIADMRARVPENAKKLSLDVPWLLIAARARALATQRVDAWRTMQQQAEQAAQTMAAAQASKALTPLAYAQQEAVLYQGAVAALRLRDTDAAAKLSQALHNLVARASKASPGAGLQQNTWAVERILNLLDADIARQEGHWAQVLRLAGSGAGAEFARPEFLLRVQAQMNLGKAQDARTELESWTKEHPQDSAAWMLLAQACDRLGLGAPMARAQGEAAIAQYDYDAGISYLKRARDLSNQNLYEASILDARIRQVQAEQKSMNEKLESE